MIWLYVERIPVVRERAYQAFYVSYYYLEKALRLGDMATRTAAEVIVLAHDSDDDEDDPAVLTGSRRPSVAGDPLASPTEDASLLPPTLGFDDDLEDATDPEDEPDLTLPPPLSTGASLSYVLL